MFDYRTLYFDGPTLDIADVLTSVGVTVKIGSNVIAWAYELGALGGDPEGLDCTPLSSLVHLEKAGVEQQEKWTVNYYFNEADYQALETLRTAGTSSTIEVAVPGGGKFTNSGKVASNRCDTVAVNDVLKAVATVELSNKWAYTPAG